MESNGYPDCDSWRLPNDNIIRTNLTYLPALFGVLSVEGNLDISWNDNRITSYPRHINLSLKYVTKDFTANFSCACLSVGENAMWR